MKVLFDDNLSPKFAEGLNQIQHPLKNDLEVTSITNEFHNGILDDDWIPKWGLQSG
jgi:hypothetical protein